MNKVNSIDESNNAKKNDIDENIINKTFEEAMSELEEIVRKLEEGELPLEESIKYFQKGVRLSRYCRMKLDEIEMKITILIEEENGNVREEIFKVKDGGNNEII